MLGRLSNFSGPLSPLFKISEIIGFITDGLILRYEISDINSYSGTNTVTDLVANSNATLVNGTTYSINGYLNLDGVNDYVMTNTSLNSDLSPANSSIVISYFTWIYPQDNGVIIDEHGSFQSPESPTTWHYSPIEMVSGNLKFGFWIQVGGVGSISSLNSSISTPLNNWYYVGITYDGVTMRTYVNGQSAGTKLITRATPGQYSQGLHYGIGSADVTNMGDGSYAKMKLGAFHVYNKALSTQEVLINYNYSKSNYIYTGSMSIWIDANDPASYITGTSVSDLSGNNYTHTLTSGATLSIVYGFRSFDCTTGTKRIEVNGTGPILPTTGYTYVVWARLVSNNFSSFRTLLYTNISGDKYTPITIPNGTNTLGWWDVNPPAQFRTSGYGLTSSVDVWVQYAVVGDNSSQTYYINDTQVGNTIPYGIGTTTHWGLGNNATANQPFGYVGNMMLYNKKLTLDEIKQNYDALKNVYKNGNFVVDNLKLYFNPSSLLSYPGTGTTINDLSGNELSGTLSNNTFINPYLNFNGSSSTITVSDNSLLEPGTDDFTVEVWIKYNIISTTQSTCIISKTDSGLAAGWGYGIRTDTSSRVYMEVGNGTTSLNSPKYTVTTNTWYQIVGVFTNVSSNSIALYVNGVSQGTPTSHSFTSVKNTTHDLSIGSFDNNIGNFGQWFNGKLGIVRIYNSALSASDVSKNFEANRGIYGI
jgi:hypothetical protein